MQKLTRNDAADTKTLRDVLAAGQGLTLGAR